MTPIFLAFCSGADEALLKKNNNHDHRI